MFCITLCTTLSVLPSIAPLSPALSQLHAPPFCSCQPRNRNRGRMRTYDQPSDQSNEGCQPYSSLSVKLINSSAVYRQTDGWVLVYGLLQAACAPQRSTQCHPCSLFTLRKLQENRCLRREPGAAPNLTDNISFEYEFAVHSGLFCRRHRHMRLSAWES